MLNKRGQFFIIFAVVIGLLLLGAASQINLANSNSQSRNFFYSNCENYKSEIFKISQYAINTANKSGEFGLILDFTKQFISYMNQTYGFELFFLYGNSSNINIANFLNNNLGANGHLINPKEVYSSSGNPMTITMDTGSFIKEYDFTKDQNFYVYIRAKKDKEVYVCE